MNTCPTKLFQSPYSIARRSASGRKIGDIRAEDDVFRLYLIDHVSGAGNGDVYHVAFRGHRGKPFFRQSLRSRYGYGLIPESCLHRGVCDVNYVEPQQYSQDYRCDNVNPLLIHCLSS